MLGGRGKEGHGWAGWKSRNRLKERGSGLETAFPKGVLPQTKARGVHGVPADAYFIRVLIAFNRDLNPRAATKRRPCARPWTLLPRFGRRPGVGLSISAICALVDAGRLPRCLIEQRGTRYRFDEPGWHRRMAICTRPKTDAELQRACSSARRLKTNILTFSESNSGPHPDPDVYHVTQRQHRQTLQHFEAQHRKPWARFNSGMLKLLARSRLFHMRFCASANPHKKKGKHARVSLPNPCLAFLDRPPCSRAPPHDPGMQTNEPPLDPAEFDSVSQPDVVRHAKFVPPSSHAAVHLAGSHAAN